VTEQQVVFDQQRQLDLIREGLQQGEQVIAVYDAVGAGTGFIGLTDRRAIIQDNSWFGKQVALASWGSSSRSPRSRSSQRPRPSRSSSEERRRRGTSTTSSSGRSCSDR
jgi:hypothetical protein